MKAKFAMNLGALREVCDSRLEDGKLARFHGTGSTGGQRELVREPVADKVHQNGERDEHVQRAAADCAAGGDQQRG